MTEQIETVEPTPTKTLPSHAVVAAKIAERLNETTHDAQRQIFRLVCALGQVQAWAILLDALEVEANGGMMLPNGSRRRTVGGIFFLLAYKGTPEAGKTMPSRIAKKTPKKTKEPKIQPSMEWDDRFEAIAETEKGTAAIMKITLIGTLGKYIDKGSCIVAVMESSEKMPTFPKGVPTPTVTRTRYTVYISSKQWKAVSAVSQDQDDALIIEGYPQLDVKTGTIAVFVSNITSKKLQAAKRASQVATA